MKYYGAPDPAPNPRRVRLVIAEKGIDLPELNIDLRKREHKSAEHLLRNTLGQVPVLELDDGTMITESVSICRYLDAIYPEPLLFGTNPVESAVIDMWTRRAELRVMIPVSNFWRHAHPLTASLIDQNKAFGESNRAVLADTMKWLDGELAAGAGYLAGPNFTIADITLLTIVDFAGFIGLAPLENVPAVRRWHELVSARPSVRGGARS